MGYLVVFSIDDAKTALFFDDYDSAADYINTTCEKNENVIRELRSTGNDDEYRVLLVSGQRLMVNIIPKVSKNVKYDLTFIKNSNKPITRRFSTRDNAITYAHKLLDDLDADADPGEDERCEWILDDPERRLSAHLITTIVVLGGVSGKDDYKTLNCSSSASKDEVKTAFKKLALKHHPDVGGDADKFTEIYDAYKRIMDGVPRKQSRKVEEEYPCFDINHLLKRMGNVVNSAKASLRAEVRNKATSLMVSGVLIFLVGAVLTAASSANTKPGGEYVIFTGAILVGNSRFLKGGYYYLYPDALINKAMKQIK